MAVVRARLTPGGLRSLDPALFTVPFAESHSNSSSSACQAMARSKRDKLDAMAAEAQAEKAAQDAARAAAMAEQDARLAKAALARSASAVSQQTASAASQSADTAPAQPEASTEPQPDSAAGASRVAVEAELHGDSAAAVPPKKGTKGKEKASAKKRARPPPPATGSAAAAAKKRKKSTGVSSAETSLQKLPSAGGSSSGSVQQAAGRVTAADISAGTADMSKPSQYSAELRSFAGGGGSSAALARVKVQRAACSESGATSQAASVQSLSTPGSNTAAGIAAQQLATAAALIDDQVAGLGAPEYTAALSSSEQGAVLQPLVELTSATATGLSLLMKSMTSIVSSSAHTQPNFKHSASSSASARRRGTTKAAEAVSAAPTASEKEKLEALQELFSTSDCAAIDQ